MKTALQWLSELPEPYNQLAINNVASYRDGAKMNYEYPAMSDSINAFEWSSAPEGHDFWNTIYEYYSRKQTQINLEQDMTRTMLSYYRRIEDIRNLQFPDLMEQLERRREEIKAMEIEAQRQIDEAVTYSTSFKDMLHKIRNGSQIADSLLHPQRVTNIEGNYISMRGDMCSFLPPNREHKVNPETGKWLRDGRQEMKPAKMARKLLIHNESFVYDESDYEKFTNAIKSYISVIGDEDGNGKNIRLELVNGDDIKKYYHWRNYSELMGKDSNLWGSCMRGDDCQDYFNIYTDNKDVCSLLVAFDKDNKILGRALIWTFKDGKRGMDTIYAHESLFDSFISWAVENQAYYKCRQSCHHQEFDMLNRERVSYEAYVKLTEHAFDYYPYMDTLSILTDSGILRTDTTPSGYDYKILRDTGGSYEDGEDEDYVTLESGDRCHTDEAYYLDYRGSSGRREGYYHESDVVFTARDEYRHRSDCVSINGDWYEDDDDDICYVGSRSEYYLSEDTIYCEHEGDTHHIDDCHELADGNWAHRDDCNICAHSGDYYLDDDLASASDGACVATENLEEYEETIKEQLNENENETAIA